MSLLYVTADKIGTPTGGGQVTHYESQALRTLGDTKILSRNELETVDTPEQEPWKWDQIASHKFGNTIKLAHLYAGTFSQSVRKSKDNNAKVAYTVAAHDLPKSRAEHEKWGVPFAKFFPHLCEPALWSKYIEGYRLADVIICPSKCAEQSVRAYGGEFETKRIEIIPHGCNLPEKVKPFPKHFSLGYLGSFGFDKGVIYLLQAWKKLAYKDGSILLLGGKDSTSDHVYQMVKQFGGSNVVMLGWIKKVEDFYNACSIYCQPSITEGHGMEVLEALAHGRPVIVSRNAGACDLVEGMEEMLFEAGNVDELAGKIDHAKKEWELEETSKDCQEIAKTCTWDKIQEKYVELWKGLLT